MQNFILILSIGLIFLSCKNSKLDCNDEEIKNIAIELLYEGTIDETDPLYFDYWNISKTEIKSFFKNNVKLKNIRTVYIDEELDQCDCQATLYFDVEKNVMDEIEKDRKSYVMNGELVDSKGVEVSYSIQETADDDIYVEIFPVSYLINSVMIYSKANDILGANSNHLDKYRNQLNKTKNTSNKKNTYCYKINADRVYFYKEPNKNKKKAYIIKGDLIKPIKTKDGYTYIEYENDK